MYASQTSDENHWKRIIQNTLSSETANSTFFFYLFITQLTDAPCPCFTDTCESTRETFFCIFTLMKNPPMHSVLLLSHSVVSNSLGPCGLQHTSLPCPSLSPGVCSNLCPLWGRTWQPTPVFLPRKSCGQRSLVGCCLWGCTESDTTEAT